MKMPTFHSVPRERVVHELVGFATAAFDEVAEHWVWAGSQFIHCAEEMPPALVEEGDAVRAMKGGFHIVSHDDGSNVSRRCKRRIMWLIHPW